MPGVQPTATLLTVEKVVVNDDGGTAVAGDFTLRVDGDPVTSGVANPVSTGTHTVSEDEVTGYTSSFGGDCDVTGSVTLNLYDNKTCTITNDDDAGPTPTPTPRPGATATATPTPTGTPISGPTSGPPTGDAIPVDESGTSVLPWLFVGLGLALTVAAVGYVIYARTGRRLFR